MLHRIALVAVASVACTSSPSASSQSAPCATPDAAAPALGGTEVPAACLTALPRVLDASGAVDAGAYDELARNLGRADGIAFRFGPDASCVQGGPSRAPVAFAAPHRYCANGNPGFGVGYTYEVGGTCNDDAGYGSTQGPVVFDADAPDSSGVDWLQYMGYGYNVMQYRPVPSWTWGARAPAPFFADADALTAHGGPFSQPVAVGRSPGNSGGENDQGAVIGFADGALRCLGTNTGPCTFAAQLPAGKVPIAIAATSDSEFTLYLVWNLTTRTAELGVMAMTSNPALGTPGGGPMPGFQQGGDFKGGTLLGFVPLPDLKGPSLLAANSSRGHDGGWKNVAGAQQSANQLDLGDEPTRQLFLGDGPNAGHHGVSGFAVVGSKAERKVTFVDLQPLFDYYDAKYFGTRADYDSTQDASWPPTFDAAPESRPVVVTTVATDDAPTAVYAGWNNPDRKTVPVHALVATMNGTLHRYDVGGLLDARPAGTVKEIDAIAVGRNVTSIVQSKHAPEGTAIYDSSLTDVVMASRGDREIEMVSYASGAGQITLRIADARMGDPISVYDSTRSKFVVTVADYTGRRVLSYRYGPFVYRGKAGDSPPIGPGPDGKSTFDFGGSWATAGRPFGVTATNVN